MKTNGALALDESVQVTRRGMQPRNEDVRKIVDEAEGIG